MQFTIGYSDGHKLIGSEVVDGADAALQAEQKCQEATDGNLSLVLINPKMSFRNGSWFVQHDGVEKALHVDHRRSPSWSADGRHWQSCYHAIERLLAGEE